MVICLRRSRTHGQFILKIITQLTLQQQFDDNILLTVKSRKILSDYKWIQTSSIYEQSCRPMRQWQLLLSSEFNWAAFV
uniref:Uncharacterized protein n=1 Tax=Oryza punctata TaxID=4537 RepID=A0A0E0JRF5_ORYPU